MGILEIIGSALKIAASWFTGYGSKENTKARMENDKTDKKDEFNEDIKNHNLDAERRKLG